MIKNILLKVFVMILAAVAFQSNCFCQTQQGYVRTIGRSNKPGSPVSGVMIKAEGPYNSVMTGSDGRFSLVLDGVKNGESYSLASVRKTGYELLDKGLQGRKLGMSSIVPLEIVLVSQSQLAAEKAAMAEKFEARFTEQYEAKVAELQARVDALEISKAEAIKERETLDDQWMKLLDQIDDMMDRYARTDYDRLSETDRRINEEIENGNFEEAERLILSKGSIDERLSQIKSDLSSQQKTDSLLVIAQRRNEEAKAATMTARENLAMDLVNLFQMAKANYQKDEALKYAEQLVELDPRNPEYLDLCGDYVREYYADYKYALELFEKGLSIRMEEQGGDHPDVALSYNNIGYIYYTQGYYTRAKDLFEKSLEIYLKISGEEDNVSTMYNNIGLVCDAQGDYSKALEMYEKSLEIAHEVYGEENLSDATVYSNMGALYHNLLDDIRAQEMFEKSLLIYYKFVGEVNPDVPIVYNNIGYVLYTLGDYTRALEMYKKGLEINLKVYGEEHPSVATGYNNIASVYSDQGDYDRALEMYEKSLYVNLKVYGESHPDVVNSYLCIGIVYEYQGEYTKAIEMYQKSLSICLEVYGDSSSYISAFYKFIGVDYFHLGQYDRAIEYLKKAVELASPEERSMYEEALTRAYQLRGEGAQSE